MTRATRKAEEKFRLRIDLTGICLYLWAVDRKSLTVVMPDAARRPPSHVLRHPDGTPAAPHVGYLRFDLKNLVTGLVSGDQEGENGSPSYEAVHRFQFEELKLGLPEGDEVRGALGLPNADVFAPVRRAMRSLDDERPPNFVLMRMRLDGGSVRTKEVSIDWKIDGYLHPDARMTRFRAHGTVVWERELSGTGLEVVLSRFGGAETARIPLRALPPRKGATPEIRLKIANLCSNPLEWSELDTPVVPGPDVDFKWLYRLLEPCPDNGGASYPPHLCPVPEPILRRERKEGDLDDCYGMQATRR